MTSIPPTTKKRIFNVKVDDTRLDAYRAAAKKKRAKVGEWARYHLDKAAGVENEHAARLRRLEEEE